MALVTQAIAEAHLQDWLDADTAVSKGQSYSIGGRSLSRVDANTIRQQIDYWQRIVERFEAAALGADTPGVRLAVAPPTQ